LILLEVHRFFFGSLSSTQTHQKTTLDGVSSFCGGFGELPIAVVLFFTSEKVEDFFGWRRELK